MPREIKFRGYHLPPGYQKGEGDWVYGYLYDENIIKENSTGWLNNSACVEETIGQYTGLKDSAGNEIYEGDILQDEKGMGEVRWVDVHCAFMCYVQSPAAYWRMECDGQLKATSIVGNIYEHPELLSSDAHTS